MKTGRIVVVTGAAGEIGSAVVRRFLANGDTVAAVDLRDPEGGDFPEDAALLKLTADISDEADCARAAEAVRSAFGRVDVLVTCAGWYPLQDFEAITAADFRRVVDVNLTGTFLTIRAFWPLMKGRNWGRIVVVGSASTFEGVPQQIHYVAAKAGLFGMARSLAKPVGQEGVTINVVTPGLTSTPPVVREMGADMIRKQAKRRALPREEQAEDLVGPIFFLASPDADFVSAQTVNVDGGSHPL